MSGSLKEGNGEGRSGLLKERYQRNSRGGMSSTRGVWTASIVLIKQMPCQCRYERAKILLPLNFNILEK